MTDTTVFICSRGQERALLKIQLEISQATLDFYKERAKKFQGGKYTPKQLMENILTNEAEGVSAR